MKMIDKVDIAKLELPRKPAHYEMGSAPAEFHSTPKYFFPSNLF